MKRSELKQLIREVIEEIQKDWYNVEGETELKGKFYVYYAEVHHSVGEDDVEVYRLEVYDMDDPANSNDTVKQLEDTELLKYFDNLVSEKYIEDKYDDGTFDEDGRDWAAAEEARYPDYHDRD